MGFRVFSQNTDEKRKIDGCRLGRDRLWRKMRGESNRFAAGNAEDGGFKILIN